MDTREQGRPAGYDDAARIGGVVLVALGILFFVQQAFAFDLGRYGWPLFILLPGLAILGAFAVGARGTLGLAVPGCVITTLGLILALQNTFRVWETWAFAWTLIPAAVGLGLRLQGQRGGQPRLVQTGTAMLEIALVAFLVFAVFFELVLDLSHLGVGPLRGVLGPALLILAGIYLLLRRGRPR